MSRAFLQARRRFGLFGLLNLPQNLECSYATIFLLTREYAKVRPKPVKPKLIKLSPAVRKALQENDFSNEEAEERKMSRNALKRRSDKGLELARLLATLTPNQVKNVIKWASLPAETFEATRVVQKMELDGVREGKRRQYNYLEGVIRHSRLDVLEYILQCVRCGETVSIKRVLEAGAPHNERYAKKTAEKWIQGLIDNDQNVCREVYCLPPDTLDMTELRNLMRELKLKLAQKKEMIEESESIEKSRRRACSKSRKVLFRFLQGVALRDYEERVKVNEECDLMIRPDAVDLLVQRMKATVTLQKSHAQGEDDSKQQATGNLEVEGNDEEQEGQDDHEVEGNDEEEEEEEEEDDDHEGGESEHETQDESEKNEKDRKVEESDSSRASSDSGCH